MTKAQKHDSALKIKEILIGYEPNSMLKKMYSRTCGFRVYIYAENEVRWKTAIPSTIAAKKLNKN